MPLLCPGCRSELTPEANMCGVCLRQRDRNEIFRGIRQLQEEQKSARRRPFIAAGMLLGVVVLAGAAYRFGPQLQALLNPPRSTAPPASPAPQEPAVAAATPAPAAQEPAPLPPGAAPLKDELPPELARMYARKKAGAKDPAAEEAEHWLVKGQVYDLLSLKPVRSARLVFTKKSTGQAFTVKAGADGRYSVQLPPGGEGGYELEASHPLYRPSYLEETEPPYKRQSEARRVEAARLIINSEVLHVPLQMPEGASELVYDVVLSPLPD